MKIRLLIAVIFFSIFTNAAFSQKINLGIKAGADLHKIMGSSFDEEFKFGYHAGAFLEIKVKNLGIQPEVYFSQVNAEKGNDVRSFLNLHYIEKVNLSYLNIPIMLNMYFTKNVALQVGPQFSLLVNESNKKDVSGTVDDTFKKGDFSLAGGLQIKISKFRVYGRYVVGLNDINDTKSSTSNEKWKNQVVHLGVGYAIL